MGGPCNSPYSPGQLGSMYERYKQTGTNPASHWCNYNEVTISTRGWDSSEMIEAFFYLVSHGKCGTCDKGCEKARDVHSKYLSTFNLNASEVPLLCYDRTSWHSPFLDMSDYW